MRCSAERLRSHKRFYARLRRAMAPLIRDRHGPCAAPGTHQPTAHFCASRAITACGSDFAFIVPYPRLEALGRKRAVLVQAVLHVEARAAQRGDRGLDRHLVAVPGGNEKTRMGVDQRMPGEIIGLEIVALAHSERALDESRGAGVENGEIARVVDDPGRIAIAPFDAHDAVIDEHAPAPLSAARAAARRRGGSPRR